MCNDGSYEVKQPVSHLLAWWRQYLMHALNFVSRVRDAQGTVQLPQDWRLVFPLKELCPLPWSLSYFVDPHLEQV